MVSITALTRSGTKIAMYVCTIGIGLLFVLPLLWFIATSLKDNSQIMQSPLVLLPKPVHWMNYVKAVTEVNFLLYLKNTLFICFGVVIGKVISCALVAYSLAKIQWRWSNLLFVLILATMMLPYQVTMVPLFIMFSKMGWTNSFKPLIIPAFFGDPLFIFLLRQFLLGIPNELMESAEIDGCNHFGKFCRICLPLLLPALGSVALFSFLWTYTDFLGPLIYLNSQEKWPLPMAILGFTSSHGNDWGSLLAACVLYTLPPVILFFVLQKTFVRGIAVTGIK